MSAGKGLSRPTTNNTEGTRLIWTSGGPYSWIARLSWSPDGTQVATASQGRGIHLWDSLNGNLRLEILIARYHVFCAAWSPDGKALASSHDDRFIRLWNPESGKMIREIEAYSLEESIIQKAEQQDRLERWRRRRPTKQSNKHGSGTPSENPTGEETEERVLLRPRPSHEDVRHVAWSPDGCYLAWCDDFGVRVGPRSGANQAVLFREQDRAISVAWSPDGRSIAATSYNGTVCIFDIEAKLLHHRLKASYGAGLAWSPDGKLIAAALGRAIGLWDAQSGQLVRVLEGHTAKIRALAFSSDGSYLVSKSGYTDGVERSRTRGRRAFEGRILLWRTDTWSVCGILPDVPGGYLYAGLSFSPDSQLLAITTEKDGVLQVWRLDRPRLYSAAPLVTSVHYKNAKVALLGDSGVGKSGLALVLTGRKFVPTDSTHARKVRAFRSDRVNKEYGPKEIRETVLWDLAGQPGYRLIHQLHLEEIAVALIVFDSKSELDPFAGVRHWNRALLQAKRLAPSGKGTKILVAARMDRGSVSVSKVRLSSVMQELDASAYIETSAKEGVGIDQLKKQIEECIDWTTVPTVTSNLLFQDIKAFLLTQKKRGKLLVTMGNLLEDFLAQRRLGDTDPSELAGEFETSIGRLQLLGLLRIFSFGNLVLLRPEILDAYASAIIFAAKNEPDGMGSILEDDVRNARFAIPGSERLKDKEEEKLLLLATTEDLISHEIALREPADDGQLLVFPSQLTRENPDLPDPAGKDLIIEFQGPVQSMYATLIVRLAHSNVFRIKEMWKNAATFEAKPGNTCGLYLTEIEEGRGTVTLFYASGASSTARHQFEDYVHVHLLRRCVPNSIKQMRLLRCPASDCGMSISNLAAEKRRERGFDWIACNVCGTTVLLRSTSLEPSPAHAGTSRDIDRAARHRKTLDAALVSASAEMQTQGFAEWAGADRTTLALVFTDVVGSTVLGDELGDEQMSEVRHAHFQQGRELIGKYKGYEIKTIGDSFMVAFRTAVQALNFALSFHKDTGHARVQIRAGIHVGPVQVEEEDAFGSMVNYTARVVGNVKGPEIWVSERAKCDIDLEKARTHSSLTWIEHKDCELKGFKGTHSLWSTAPNIPPKS